MPGGARAWPVDPQDEAGDDRRDGDGEAAVDERDGGLQPTLDHGGPEQPDRRGQYSIEGYTLTLRCDSGRVERRLIVADPADTKTLWLDGDGWVRR